MSQVRIFFDNIYRDSLLQLHAWIGDIRHEDEKYGDPVELGILSVKEYMSKKWLIAYDFGNNAIHYKHKFDTQCELTDEDPVEFIKNRFVKARVECRNKDCKLVHIDDGHQHVNLETRYCPMLSSEDGYTNLIIVDADKDYPADRHNLPGRNYDVFVAYHCSTH